MKPKQLIIKKLTGKLSKREERAFEEWFQRSDSNKEMFAKLKTLEEEGTDLSKLEFSDAENAWDRILQKHHAVRLRKRKKGKFLSLIKYAAVFAGMLLLGYGYFDYTRSKEKVVLPSPDVITLQLDNGDIRVLPEKGSRTIVDKEGGVVGNKSGKKLDYKNNNQAEKLSYNTLKVPYGKRFEIALSDGTNVHLNAGSSIRYPVRFLEGNERRVFLTGEAFFDVSSDKQHPFIVSTSQMDVTVTGTRFNVAAYPEDEYINTVLVAGEVSLSDNQVPKNGEHQITRLSPGHKAEWDVDTQKATVQKVDTDIYTGWIEGRLVLKNLAFKSIMKKLERHYNVEIQNNYDDLNRQVFTASFDVEGIEEVLASFAENRPFEYRIKDRVITIGETEKK